MLQMVHIAEKATDKDESHCRRYSGVDHKTIHQLMMPKHLGVVFQWFVTPF